MTKDEFDEAVDDLNGVPYITHVPCREEALARVAEEQMERGLELILANPSPYGALILTRFLSLVYNRLGDDQPYPRPN